MIPRKGDYYSHPADYPADFSPLLLLLAATISFFASFKGKYQVLPVMTFTARPPLFIAFLGS